MSPEGRELRQERARHEACKVRCARLEEELLLWKKGKPIVAKPSPRGHVDGKAAGHAVGVGAISAPVGMWTQDMVDTIYAGFNMAGPGLKTLMQMKMMEDVIGAACGFVCGAVATLVWKFMKNYGPK